MLGWIAVRMRPPMRMCTPITASSSGRDHPRRLVVYENTRASTIRPRGQCEERLEDIDEEVHPVLQLVHRPDAEEDPRQPGHAEEVPVHPPTAVYLRIAVRQANLNRTALIATQSACIPRPTNSSRGARFPASERIGN